MPASTEIKAMDAIDACEAAGCVHHTRKWWSATLGISEQQLSRWANSTGERYLRASELMRIVEVLGDIHAEHALDLVRDLIRPAGLTVEPLARPEEPAAASRRAFANASREDADVVVARMDSDEDGIRTPDEIRRELHETRQAEAAKRKLVTALEQELADAENPRPGLGSRKVGVYGVVR